MCWEAFLYGKSSTATRPGACRSLPARTGQARLPAAAADPAGDPARHHQPSLPPGVLRSRSASPASATRGTRAAAAEVADLRRLRHRNHRPRSIRRRRDRLHRRCAHRQRSPTGELFERTVNPRRCIPKELIRFHGITDEMVKDKPPIQVVLPQFRAFVGDAVLVAHNAAFDLKFLKMREEECGVRFKMVVLDAVVVLSA